MTSRRPMRMTGKYAFQASAQSASWTIRVAQLADRPQPERLEVPERLGDLGRGSLGGGTVARRQVRPDDRRPARVEPRAETLVDQFERGLDATSRRALPDRGSR